MQGKGLVEEALVRRKVWFEWLRYRWVGSRVCGVV
jgi:hypothetical protein